MNDLAEERERKFAEWCKKSAQKFNWLEITIVLQCVPLIAYSRTHFCTALAIALSTFRIGRKPWLWHYLATMSQRIQVHRKKYK